MSNKKTQNEVFIAGEIFDRLKDIFQIKKNKDLAKEFGLTPNELQRWKTRGHVPYGLILSKCKEKKIDPMLVFFNVHYEVPLKHQYEVREDINDTFSTRSKLDRIETILLRCESLLEKNFNKEGQDEKEPGL